MDDDTCEAMKVLRAQEAATNRVRGLTPFFQDVPAVRLQGPRLPIGPAPLQLHLQPRPILGDAPADNN
eukprot:6025563-Karenia_brevis.AAC.1